MTAEPLSRDRAVFLLVDHHTGVFERVVKSPPRDQQMGITLTTTASVSAELAGDYPKPSQIMRGG